MKVLRDPLFHFAALGGALFLAYAVMGDLLAPERSKRIEIGEAEVALLTATWQRQWGRPPTEAELRGLVEARAREEVLYREALAMGLDEADVVVRRRMVQKMELLSQDLALLADPTDTELRAFFQERREDYRVPARVSFSHVYFNPDRRGASVEEDARGVLAEIRAETPTPQRAPERGDRFMLPHDYALQSPQEVQRQFGSVFAEELFALEDGWHGPVPSGYGLHLVNVGERVEGRIPEYSEVRDRLAIDFDRERAERGREALYEAVRESYEIVIDDEALRTATVEGAPR